MLTRFHRAPKGREIVLFKGRRWIQPAEAAKLLGMSPHYFKKLLYRGEVHGFTILERCSVGDRIFHWFALDEVMAATNGADLSRRMRTDEDPKS